MTKKVCLVGPVYPYRGGIAHFTSLLAKEFAKDHEVLVVSFTRLYPSFLFPGKTQFDESETRFTTESKRVIDSLNPISFWRAARLIARFGPDLVVFQWWQPFLAFVCATIAHFVRRSSSARIVYLCHNVLPHDPSPVNRLLIRIGFSQVCRFVVQSREDRQNLLSIKANAKVALQPHPIYDVFNVGRYTRESAREELGVDGRVLLFFGYVRPYKGLDILIEAFAKSLERLESTLLIVGEYYENKAAYVTRIENLGAADRVVIVDRYVANEEVEKYFAACDLVVLPYRSATQSGIVQVAYGFNKPVIVTAVGGLPDVVKDGVTGYVVPPNDPDALSLAITRFFDEKKAGEMGRQIAVEKDRFSWERCKESVLGVAVG